MLQSFPKLTPQQLKHLIDSFEPDEISPTPVPHEVRNMVRLSCPYDGGEPQITVPARLTIGAMTHPGSSSSSSSSGMTVRYTM